VIASVSEKNRTNKLCVAQLRGCSLMALGTQGTAAILNPDTMSDTGSGTSSGSDEEGPRERHQAPSKGENGDDPLALFSACVSAWNSGEGEKPESAEETGGEVKRVRKDRRIHRTAEERKQVSMRPPQPTCTHHNLTSAAPCALQRRLETNRLAAKRAYYRRQGKANAMKDENDRLKMLVEKYGACGPHASLLLPKGLCENVPQTPPNDPLRAQLSFSLPSLAAQRRR
jgi:hypothetical protein